MELVIDVWEGTTNLHPDILALNNVGGVIVRLNGIQSIYLPPFSGHRKDKKFDINWKSAEGFARAVYFVYNPFKSGKDNFAWFNTNCPPGAFVFLDIELAKTGYSGKDYGDQVAAFIYWTRASGHSVDIYTGQNYLSLLTDADTHNSCWPVNVGYWWAQYPYHFYPSDATKVDWNWIWAEISNYDGPMNKSLCPSKVDLWQFTGDRLILPGAGDQPVDISVYPYSKTDLQNWWSYAPITGTIPPTLPPPIQPVPAIPGPAYILSHREAGDGWFWPDGKLDAYPATVSTRGGNGNIHLSMAWQTALRLIMTALQWTRTWIDQEGWHNFGNVGDVREVEFSHNLKWITQVNPDGFYEYDVYYNNETPPNLASPFDKYRRGIMTVDYKTGHENTGGVINSDLLLPVLSIANDRIEKLRIDPKYIKLLVELPLYCNVKTGGSNLNIRNLPTTKNSTIIGSIKDGTPITIYELHKTDNDVWGRINALGDTTVKWIACRYTNASL